MNHIKIALIALTIVIAVLGMIFAAPQAQQQNLETQRIARLKEKESRAAIKLIERVELAKATGKQKVVVPAIESLYNEVPGPAELNHLLSSYTVFIAQPITEKSYIYESENVRTWYKFKILERLSTAAPLVTFISREIPEEFLPLEEDELAVHREGGILAIEGVEVIQNEQGVPRFEKTQRYLLVLSFDPSTRIGELTLGPNSFLRINSDNSLDTSESKHLLQKTLTTYHGGSLERLKTDLKGRPSSQ